VQTVDHKDRYTRKHSEEVTRWALTVARRLALSNETERALRIAGLLHDVGKIGIPDSILRKPGQLSSEEFEVVKQHALLSELIIKEVPNLGDVMAAVGSHHERWDGTGYPRGLQGDHIPLLGRILAVADAYSAMTSDRPYRKALTGTQAREELINGAGSQFDPEIVAAFLAGERDPGLPLAGAGREAGSTLG
jgi:HD-GYP domain-containing protein (c-di-GMP phosphodiesterase class II)